MTSDDNRGRFQLEASTGPLKGARFPLVDAVTIGRSSQVEIFIADADVSRRHAKVMALPNGGHVLIDLGSANGTRVDGQTIAEHRLQPGDTFTIGGTAFVYAEARVAPVLGTERGAYAVSGAPGSAVDRLVVTLASDRETFDDGAEEVEHGSSVDRLPVRFDARSADGALYPGDLLSDVILYRNLRLRLSRGDAMPPQMRASFDTLEERLRAPRSERDDPGGSREFARYLVRSSAFLRLSRHDEVGRPVEIRDFGVGGSRLNAPGLQLELDELTWLAIDLSGDGGPRSIVFTSRVVWMRGGELGLVFSGAPGWSRHSGTNEQEDTLFPARVAPSARRTRQLKLRLAGSDEG